VPENVGNSDAGETWSVKVEPRTVRFQLKELFGKGWWLIPRLAMLTLVPTGIALYYCNANMVAVFFVNFFATVPIGTIQGVAAECLVQWLGAKFSGRTGYILAEVVYQAFK
jgi:hypothetical protein